jgi:peptidoglycan/xylan/chitin deacetylase (PgdA/CDA1 family)
MSSLKLPIAMFHHVSDRADWASLRPFVIQESTFIRFLTTIEKARMRTVTFADMQEGKLKHSRRDLIISFDDCGKHLLDFVVPELVRRNMKAVFYMPTANLGGHNTWNVEQGRSEVKLMNASDLVELQKSGMEVGGHSHDHIHLARLSSKEVSRQLKSCQTILTKILGKSATSFAYPYGSIPSNAKTALVEAGFADACAIFSPRQEPHMQRRFIVHDGDSNWTMRIKLHSIYQQYRCLTDARKSESAWQ